ncbi:hypothetical protein FSP39_023774 [Pinctada imbricata]|uniref:Uncharacterized protein n=1 Tax=Pinctada imbricata TaxID=66713 RepID=A0AA88XX94_PINIB|nr:hypothetical protein FSP39_023774 [Pinctada imbricata]
MLGSYPAFSDETSFVIRKYIRDPDKLKKYLVDDLHVMTELTAEALLNSTLNVVELTTNLGYFNFRRIVCSPDELKQYMIFPSGANIVKISDELCHINNDSIPTITDAVLKQIDVAAIIRSAKLLTTVTGKYELNDALDDIASLVDLLFSTSSFSSILQDLPMLMELPNLIRQMPSWFDKLINMQQFDTSSLDAIVNFLDPIIEKVSPESEPWNVTKQAVGQIKEIIGAVGDGKTLIRSFISFYFLIYQ